MHGRAQIRRWTAAGTVVLVAALATACGGTPGASQSSVNTSKEVQKTGFDKLGPVNLTVWSYDNQDPGLEPVLKELSANFTKKYPNVKITMVFKSFNDLVNVVPRALASDQGPDITEGNQGYQTDAALVKARLIIPLDPYIKAYGWDDWYSDSTWSIFRWTDDGKTFGQGPKWGVAQTGQNVAVFANTEKLKALGYDLGQNALNEAFGRFKDLADKKKHVFDDDIIALVDDALARGHDRIQVKALRVIAGTEGPQEAQLTVTVDGVERSAKATGDGPVDAVFNAIHEVAPHSAVLRLFQVHAVTEGTDAQAQVSVRLEEDGRIATGQAADTDTLTASAMAYINALNNLSARKEKTAPAAREASGF